MTQQEFTARYTYDPKSDQLGAGGFGSVYKAYDNEDDKFVALKIAAVDPQHPELRLREEVAKAAELKHKNVARYDACYTFTTFSGEMDIAVMHYYEHGSLDGFMRRGDLSMGERHEILAQILEGVAYLHGHGIIHRDLKPQNVLMVHHAGRYIPKITDFGISKQLEDGESSLVSNSVLGGTRSFASPEQLCEREIRKNTDLWSFGVIAYYMLVGELPFTTGTLSASSDEGRSEQLRQILSGRLPESISTIAEPWQRVIRGCLVVDGTQRLQHAEDCLALLRDYKPAEERVVVSVDDDIAVAGNDDVTVIDGHIEEEYAVLPTPSVPEPSKKKSKWWLWLIIAAIILAGAFLFGGGDSDDMAKDLESALIEKRRAKENMIAMGGLGRDGIYRVGDYYNRNGKEGVVFEVWDDGRHGKIVSLDEYWFHWCTDNQFNKQITVGASSESDGRDNTDKVMSRMDSKEYPAFTWCRAKGAEWYLPAKNELMTIYNNKSEINSTLELYGDAITAYWYLSSTELGELCAWSVRMSDGGTGSILKYDGSYVRAVSAF